MKTINSRGIQVFTWLIAITVVLVFSTVSVQANPIALPEKPITPKIAFIISIAILLEVICVVLVLHRSRKPRFLVLWLIGMHVLTYPGFLRLLWLMDGLRPALAVAVGEGTVILVEGGLIFLMCRYLSSSKSDSSPPSITKCEIASLIGNLCSAGAFPGLLAVYDHLFIR